MKLIPKLVTTLLFLFACSSSMSAQSPLPGAGLGTGEDELDLSELSLEELMNIEVTVASGGKTKQKLNSVPAAVYVLTGDEIRRAGHSSVQEALRMVPGFQVSHWTNSMWDVTTRGYGPGLSLTNSAYLNQLLVMIDGVPVYTPLFAGVWWALQDIPVRDIDRIEIIRGPGGILWGANSEHGVVNVITKNAADTSGTALRTWVGGENQHYGASHTLRLGDKAHLRVWSRMSEYEDPDNPFGDYPQRWTMNTAGFRADWESDDGIQYNLWTRAYRGRFRNIGFDLVFFNPFSSLNDKDGGQIAFNRTNPETGEKWSAWYQLDNQDIQTHVDIDIKQYDIEYSRQLQFGENHQVSYGAGFRYIYSKVNGDDPFYLDFAPGTRRLQHTRAYLNDTIKTSESTRLVLGLQLLDNEFTGFEVQPSIRGTWQPDDTTLLWGAVSRAVRTPSLEETSLTQDSRFIGDPDFESEELLAGELGTRVTAGDWGLFDLALFLNDYEKLHNTTFDGVFSSQISNGAAGNSYGGELAVDLKPTDRWSLRGAYSRLFMEFNNLGDTDEVVVDEYSPRELFNLRSYYDLTDELELDIGVYMVNGLSENFDIAEYWRGDVRLGYKPSETVEISVGVQGFDDPVRNEFDSFDGRRRQFYFTLDWNPGRRVVD